MPRYRQPLVFIPKSENFVDLQVFTEDSEGLSFDVCDDGFLDKAFSDINAEQTLLHILSELNDRDKAIFAFEILRKTGYNITHDKFAKTFGISRVRYMIVLKRIRQKTAKLFNSINKGS